MRCDVDKSKAEDQPEPKTEPEEEEKDRVAYEKATGSSAGLVLRVARASGMTVVTRIVSSKIVIAIASPMMG